MKNKYYTPEIEEFHVGFECEIQSSWGMQKGIYPSILREDTLTGFQLQKIGETETLKKVISGIRVKYLDKKDIESLGFSYYKTHPGMEQMEFDKGEYELTYDPNFKGRQWLRINLEGEGGVTLFSGSIKNKSELKKLLKQLNIK
jgi:hypothetical protein